MTLIQTLEFLLSAVASYAAFFYKLRQVRRGWHDLAYVALTITLGLQCLTFTMGVVSTVAQSLFGVHNLGLLILHLSAVSYCISAQILLLLWANPPEAVRRPIRYWLLSGVALGVVLVALFFLGDAVHKPSIELSFGTKDPVLLSYLLLFIISQATPCVTIFFQCLPSARAASDPWLRRGLRLLGLAAAVLLLYCLARTGNILSPVLGVRDGWWRLFAAHLSFLGIVLISVALTMPSWGGHLSSAAKWVRDYFSYKALYPLWNSLYQAAPGIALEPPSSSVSDLNYRLYRRVVEIRDGWRTLRPYMNPADTSSGNDGELAMAEARKIKQALAVKQASPAGDRGASRAGFEDRDPQTFAAEVAWLKAVSNAFSRVRD